jgi:hypothetical protein
MMLVDHLARRCREAEDSLAGQSTPFAPNCALPETQLSSDPGIQAFSKLFKLNQTESKQIKANQSKKISHGPSELHLLAVAGADFETQVSASQETGTHSRPLFDILSLHNQRTCSPDFQSAVPPTFSRPAPPEHWGRLKVTLAVRGLVR